jgi:hypothetical protein
VVKFSRESVRSWTFLYWEIIAASISFHVIDLFRLVNILLVQFWMVISTRNLSISSRFSKLLILSSFLYGKYINHIYLLNFLLLLSLSCSCPPLAWSIFLSIGCILLGLYSTVSLNFIFIFYWLLLAKLLVINQRIKRAYYMKTLIRWKYRAQIQI